MRSAFRISLVVLSSFGLFACGGAKIAATKEAAAQALFYSSKGASGAPGGLYAMMRQAATATIDTTAACPNGGQVTVKLDVNSVGQTANIAFDLAYDHCNYDHRNAITGTMHVVMDVVTSTGSVALAMTMTGRVDFSGEISDYVDANITETISATQLSATSGSVSITLNGTITTSSGTYTYTDETVNITADGITPAAS